MNLSNLANRKFEEAELTFRRFDKLIHKHPSCVYGADLQCIIADLDACIAGLSGSELGLAYTIKANCLYYDFVFGSPAALLPDPHRKVPLEALRSARKGRQLLAKYSPDHVSWADSVIRQIEGCGNNRRSSRRAG